MKPHFVYDKQLHYWFMRESRDGVDVVSGKSPAECWERYQRLMHGVLQ